MNMIKNCTSCSLANYLTTFIKSSTYTIEKRAPIGNV